MFLTACASQGAGPVSWRTLGRSSNTWQRPAVPGDSERMEDMRTPLSWRTLNYNNFTWYMMVHGGFMMVYDGLWVYMIYNYNIYIYDMGLMMVCGCSWGIIFDNYICTWMLDRSIVRWFIATIPTGYYRVYGSSWGICYIHIVFHS